MLAVLEALKFVVAQGWKYRGDFVQVCVDSQLVVKLMTKEWNARDATLADNVDEINNLRRKERMRI
jgi:ribonuclease HI